MAIAESKRVLPGAAAGTLTGVEVAKMGEQAFLVASWQAREREADEEGVQSAAELFREDLSQAFEALVCCRSDRDGCGFLAQGHGQWVERVLAEIPRGWRPAYVIGSKL